MLHQRHQVDDGLAARAARTLRHFVHFQPVDASAIGEAQNVIVRVRDKQLVDKIFFFGRRRLLAAAAAFLRAVVRHRLRFHVAAVRQRDHHIFAGDQIFIRDIAGLDDDFAETLAAVLLFDFSQFRRNNFGHARGFRQNVEQIDDFFHRLFVFLGDLVGFQRGQVLQAHFENALRLHVG